MDPFSITVGVLGVSQLAVSSIIQLRNTIDGISEAKEVIEDIAVNLGNIQRSAKALESLTVKDSTVAADIKADLKRTGVVEAIDACDKACAKFDTDLKKWTRHSTAGKTSLRDKLSVGVWNVEKIRTFRTRVRSCQSTAQFAVQSAQLLIQIRSSETTSAQLVDAKTQLSTLESIIQSHLDQCSTQHAEAEQRLQLFQNPADADAGDSDSDDDAGQAQRTLAMAEMKKQIDLIEETSASDAAIFAQVKSGRTGQYIGDVIVEARSKLFAGMPSSAVGKMDQRIGNITLREDSAAALGVGDGDVNFGTFFD